MKGRGVQRGGEQFFKNAPLPSGQRQKERKEVPRSLLNACIKKSIERGKRNAVWHSVKTSGVNYTARLPLEGGRGPAGPTSAALLTASLHNHPDLLSLTPGVQLRRAAPLRRRARLQAVIARYNSHPMFLLDFNCISFRALNSFLLMQAFA